MRKQSIKLAMVAAAAAALFGCGPAKPQLSVFIWSDYIDPALVRQFEAENGCRVLMDNYDSNEAMLAKIEAGAGGYDIIVPTSYTVEKLAAAGRVEKIDKAKIPNIKNIDPAYLATALDADMAYGVPYMVTYTGLAYRKDKIPGGVPATWDALENLPSPECAKRVTLMNDFRETIGAALIKNGFDPNSTNAAEIAAARDTVIKWKKNIAKFDNETYKNGVASGEFLLVHGYSGDIGQVQAEDAAGNIGFILPEEGFLISCDELVIMKDAPQKDLAYKFINFIHDAQNAARNMEFTAYWCPNTPAYEFTPDEIKGNATVFPGADVIKKGKVIRNVDGAALELYTQAWDEIKAAE